MTIGSTPELTVTVAGVDLSLEDMLAHVDSEMQKSADQAVRLGQSYARLAQAQQNPTLASQVLAGTMESATATSRTSEKAILSLATSQAKLGNSSSGLSSQIAGISGQLSQLGGSAGSLAGKIGTLTGAMGPLAAIGVTIEAGTAVVAFAKAGAQADRTAKSFDRLATAAGTSGDALLTAMRAASGGEISDLNLQLAANRANLLGVASSAEELGTLMEIARDRAQNMGITTTQAFDNLVTGLGRGSPLILDNLGLTVSVSEANQKYADSLGKTASKLTEAEQKQALINAVLEQGRASLAATGGAVESTAGQFERLDASMENIKNRGGAAAAEAMAPIITGLSDLLNISSSVPESMGNAAIAAQNFARSLSGLPPLQASIAQQNLGMISSFFAWATGAETAAQKAATAAAAAKLHGVAMDEDRTRIGEVQVATLNYATAIEQNNAALELNEVRARAAAAAAEIKANADKVASIDAQTHAIADEQLANQAQNAARALLAAGPAGANTAALLAGSSQQVDILTAAYYRLFAAQQAVGGPAAAKAARAADFSERHGGIEGGGKTTPAQRALAAQQQLTNAQILANEKASKAEQARRDQLLQTGTAAQKAAVLQEDYNLAVKRFGANSAEAINAQTALKREQQTAAKGGRGGGGAKLSDQQKLQNSLLDSQQAYQDRSEGAERDHVKKVLDINRDFADKMKAAQDSLNQTQLESRAGFYDSLGGIEDAGLRQAFAAQYEAAFAEADRIAQEKGADVGQRFLEEKQKALESQAGRASDIAQAEKDKDKDKAEYLRGVDKLYREAEDRKLAAIKEGGGSLASERDAALAQEASDYQSKQDEMAASADNAAERRINASLRSGKKIDEEGLKVDELTARYTKLGEAGARAGITPSPTSGTPGSGATALPATPGGTVAPSPVSQTGGAGEDPIVGALNGAKDAIVAAIGAVERASKDTSSAVRGLGGKLVT